MFASWIFLKLGLPVDHGAARKISADPQSENAPIAWGLSTQLSYVSFWVESGQSDAALAKGSRWPDTVKAQKNSPTSRPSTGRDYWRMLCIRAGSELVRPSALNHPFRPGLCLAVFGMARVSMRKA